MRNLKRFFSLKGNKRKFSMALLALATSYQVNAQNDVMMQAFYWDVPVDATNKNGTWWDNLSSKAAAMKAAGYTGIWVPSPAKGNYGIYDMGYGIFDHYDLGNYTQKGTTETRFGSRTELNAMITKMHQNNIHVYADIILNHIYTDGQQAEANPAVKTYVFNEAKVNGTQYQSYPTDEITWVLPSQTAGDYYIRIKGYNLPWDQVKGERGYDVTITYGSTTTGDPVWESEPNNGGGSFNTFPGSGRTMRAHIESASDLDEFKISLASTQNIVIKLTAKREKTSPTWEWVYAAQTNGFYPYTIYKGSSLLNSSLQAQTNTKINVPTKTGTGEATISWGYADFHPVDGNDWLGYPGTDEIITNTKFFGNDLNTFSTSVQTKLKDWGVWMSNTVGFDGYRLDFVRGFQESLVADWVNNLPKMGTAQRFIVGEYWGSDSRIKSWVNNVASYGADVDGFDFPLKNSLKDMCNGDQNFDMNWLNNAGMVRNNSGNALPGTSVVTFLDNHDTGKEHDKWVTKDFKMGYAYMLTHEGRPCVFYPHYYGVKQVDSHDPSYTVQAPADLKDDIDKLMFARRTYLGGTLNVLSQTGNPYPSTDTKHVYAARRNGNATKNGAIVVINNHGSNTMGLWVDSSPSGFQNWAGVTLVNAFNSSQTTVVEADGRVYVSAPARGYTVWVRQDEYVTYSAPTTTASVEDSFENEVMYNKNLNVYPNPAADKVTVDVGDVTGPYSIKIHNLQGQLVFSKQILNAAKTYELSTSNLKSGYYIIMLEAGNRASKTKLLIER